MRFIKFLAPLLLISLLTISCNEGASQSRKKKWQEEEERYTIELNQEEFIKRVANYKANPEEWFYKGDKPAIVDFWAEWCSFCRKLNPILEELAKEYKGEIYIYKVNTDKERELAKALGIRSLPTLLFIPMDSEPQVAMGALPKEELKAIIESLLLN